VHGAARRRLRRRGLGGCGSGDLDERDPAPDDHHLDDDHDHDDGAADDHHYDDHDHDDGAADDRAAGDDHDAAPPDDDHDEAEADDHHHDDGGARHHDDGQEGRAVTAGLRAWVGSAAARFCMQAVC
jgi:hypothetical protein